MYDDQEAKVVRSTRNKKLPPDNGSFKAFRYLNPGRIIDSHGSGPIWERLGHSQGTLHLLIQCFTTIQLVKQKQPDWQESHPGQTATLSMTAIGSYEADKKYRILGDIGSSLQELTKDFSCPQHIYALSIKHILCLPFKNVKHTR